MLHNSFKIKSDEADEPPFLFSNEYTIINTFVFSINFTISKYIAFILLSFKLLLQIINILIHVLKEANIADIYLAFITWPILGSGLANGIKL